MASQFNNHLKVLLHPYVFILKEGRGINDDFLDYTLQIMQITCPEKIPSPKKKPSLKHIPLSDNEIQSFSSFPQM